MQIGLAKLSNTQKIDEGKTKVTGRRNESILCILVGSQQPKIDNVKITEKDVFVFRRGMEKPGACTR